MSQTLFYATTSDLATVLSSPESEEDLKYTLTGLFETNATKTYRSYLEIPNLGLASHPTAVANELLPNLGDEGVRRQRLEHAI